VKAEGEEVKSKGKESEEYCSIDEDVVADFLEKKILRCAEDTPIATGK